MYAPISVIVPAAVVANLAPRFPTNHVAAIGAVDCSFIEMRPVEVLPEAAGENDVGVEVEDPVVRPDLVNRPLDQPRLVERPIAAVLFGKDVPDRHLLAHAARLVIVGRRHDDEVVDKTAIDTGALLEEIAVTDTDCDRLDFQSDSPIGRARLNRGSALAGSSRSHQPASTRPKPAGSN